MFAPEKNVLVYDQKFWWSDDWDPMAFGREYDWQTPFFEQWKDFRNSFPLQSVSNSNAIGSDYCNVNDDAKDCYLISGSFRNERTLYSNRISYNKDCSDLYVVHRSEFCYEDVICADSHRLFYSLNCSNCIDSYFLYDCRNCSNCFGCTNLRNKNYHIFNEPYTKEQYFEKLKEFDLGSYSSLQKFRPRYRELYQKAVHKFANILKSIHSSGDNIENAKNCNHCFDIAQNTEDAKYSHWGVQAKDMYDSGPGYGGGAELLYETFDTGIEGAKNFFTSVVYGSHTVYYSFNCYSCSNLFGCIGLRSKHYCILNKQYTKEEYEALIPKIIAHMDAMPYVDKNGCIYKFGEFFPAEISPFAYNETVAQDYFPLTKETAVAKGYAWRDREAHNYNVTIDAKDLPDHIHDVTDAILTEVIGCLHKGERNNCTTAFKITRPELEFYRRLALPLPRYCFSCRHAMRLDQRNPMKLWHRSCMCDKTNHSHEGPPAGGCPNEFETSYAPDRPETIYCEKCYQQEVI